MSRAPAPPRWRALLAALALAGVAALWAGKYLPFTDLPQHVAAIASLRHFGDPAWHVRDYFALSLMLATLALAVRDAAAPALRRTVLLATCAVALFYLHLSAFVLFAPCA